MNSDNYHHGDLKQALIAKANLILSQGDIEKLSIRHLAKACNVSATAVYRHFDNKENLLTQLATNGFDTFTNYMKNNLQSNDTPVIQLKKIGTAYIQYALKNPHLFRLLFSSLPANQTESSLLKKSSRETYKLLTSIIKNGIKLNYFEGEVESLTLTAWSMVHGLATLLIDKALESGDKTHLNTIIKNAINLLYSGMCKKSL